MADKKILFKGWTYSRNLPEPFDDLKNKRRTDIQSIYSNLSTPNTGIHGQVLTGIIAYMFLQKSKEDSNYITNRGAIGTQGDNYIISEYQSRRNNELHICVFNKNDGKFLCSVENGTGKSTEYLYEASGQSGSALLFTLIPLAMKDDEFKEHYKYLYDEFKNGYKNLKRAIDSAYILCDNFYRRIENAENLGSIGIKIHNSLDSIPLLTEATIGRNIYSPDNVILGEFIKMKVELTPKKKAPTTNNADFIGAFKLSNREFTFHEKQQIPDLPTWFIRPFEVDNICKHAKETSNSCQPMRNFMLRGPSGVGKTEIAKAISAGLGIPYKYFTCSANTEEYDLFEKAVFESDSGDGSLFELPTFQDIQIDPATAYKKMTGEYIEQMDVKTVYSKLIETIENNTKSKFKSKDAKQRIVYQETELTKAVKNGYLIELQEPSVISNPAVLVALNSLLDGCSTITLPHTGKIIKRHPDTVFIMTTNNDYFGCRPMNQSILSRMNLIKDIPEPDENDMILRVSKITGFKARKQLKQMVKAVKSINDFCKNQSITDGCCGMRELISWVQSFMIVGDLIETAKYTVVSSASSVLENQEEIIEACLNPIFPK